jgi:hypothetical protein
MMHRTSLIALAILYPFTGPATAETLLAEDGKARLPIVVARAASERERQAAAALADYLHRITGGKFEVQAGDGRSGIAIGQAAHFPELPFQKLWDLADPTQSENYLLRSHDRGLYLLGASDLAVENAVWDLLHRLGHRQFFPGPTWEVVPRVNKLAATVDVREQPAYHMRRIWYGYGPGEWAAKPYADWCVRNRAVGGIALNTGHAYDGILSRNKAAFAAHPEYLGLVGGQRKSSKFCIANPGLRQLVCDDALRHFQANPAAQSVSVDPSDGGGWCECDRCKALGSVSDRALTLANAVAEAVNARYPGKFVGMYAYNQHSPPPSMKVHPRVVISVATSFITGGWTVDQLLEGWQKQGATIGIREYYSVITWDHDLPGAARGARPDYLKTSIPHFHAKGARFLSSEASDNWGPNGLGYYLAAQMLWDVRAADRLDALKADFLEKAFGPAREPMARFYQLLDGGNRPLLSDDLVGRMFRLLDDALKMTDDPAIRARLHDLVLYTRYVELWMAYANAEGPTRQKAFEELIRHAWRMRGTMMIHTKGLYRDLPARDKSVTVPTGAAWNVPEGKNPWKNSDPFTAAELAALVRDGIAGHKLLDFQPVSFSDNLLPAGKLGLPAVAAGNMGNYSRGARTYFTWVADPPATLSFQAKAGIVYGNRGPARVAIFPAAEAEGKAVAEASVPPDKEEHEIKLATTFPGLHRVTIADATAGTGLTWPDGVPMTVKSSTDDPANFSGRWSLYFYVPKGARVVGGFASGAGNLLNGDGKAVHTFGKEPGYFSVPVPAGQDGKLWKFQNSVGRRLLMTVPPFLARNGQELLLPAEVVARDAAK